jgi:glycosyltransferase involved in cell wall biosynthesis
MKQFPGRILVVNPDPVYPVMAMNQMRTNNMIRILSQDFEVSLATPVESEEINEESKKKLGKFGGKFYSLGSVKYKKNFIIRKSYQIYKNIGYYFFGYDKEILTYKIFENKILNLIRKNNFNIVISNYWEGSLFFRKLNSDYLKILDPHYSVRENCDVFKNNQVKSIKRFFEKRRLKRNLKYEAKIVKLADLTLPLSKRNYEEFCKIAPDRERLLIPDGNDIEYFSNYPRNPDPDTILFYGAMGSRQNRNAFFRFYNNIYPSLKNKFKNLKVLVVGANPPPEIIQLNDNINFEVTGFVPDVRPFLAKAWLCIIPLELGSGFRGRVIELMAMGIPVVGTHNALDSIDMTNGFEGYITDSDSEMIKDCILLMSDSGKRHNMGKRALEFVKRNYSLETTFGKLNNYFNEIFK